MTMRLVLDIKKSVEENAQHYFEAAKKARKKAKGAQKLLQTWKDKVPKIQKEKPVKRKQEWYEKFRWCIASNGSVLVAGRDATTNEQVIKKHVEPDDIVFHTDMAGSPFVVIKGDSNPKTFEEAAQFCATFSRAWKSGMSSIEAFRVHGSQLTKDANAGESLGKGAFVVRGKTIYHKPQLALAIGLDNKGRVMAGPPSAVFTHCQKSIKIIQGNQKTSDVAKEIKKKIGGTLDEIIAALPAGGLRVA